MIAHVSGVPLEEVLPSLTGAGVGLLVARAWMTARLQGRPKHPFADPSAAPGDGHGNTPRAEEPPREGMSAKPGTSRRR
jgi:hypothetical protein